jgi:hypothetical protein
MTELALFDDAERLSAIATITLARIKPVKRTPRADAKQAQAERIRALTARPRRERRS